jgi:hypothetical protein
MELEPLSPEGETRALGSSRCFKANIFARGGAVAVNNKGLGNKMIWDLSLTWTSSSLWVMPVNLPFASRRSRGWPKFWLRHLVTRRHFVQKLLFRANS